MKNTLISVSPLALNTSASIFKHSLLPFSLVISHLRNTKCLPILLSPSAESFLYQHPSFLPFARVQSQKAHCLLGNRTHLFFFFSLRNMRAAALGPRLNPGSCLSHLLYTLPTCTVGQWLWTLPLSSPHLWRFVGTCGCWAHRENTITCLAHSQAPKERQQQEKSWFVLGNAKSQRLFYHRKHLQAQHKFNTTLHGWSPGPVSFSVTPGIILNKSHIHCQFRVNIQPPKVENAFM